MSIQIVEIAQPSVIDTVAVAQPSTVALVEIRQGPAGDAGGGSNNITSATTSDGTADLDLLNVDTVTATVSGTLTASHIHGNLAGNVYCHIRAGEALAKGDPVYVSGSHGSDSTLIPIVSKADASNAAKMPAIGIMDAAVANNANGHMVIVGTITELDTTGLTVNTELYVDAGGGMTATPPTARAQPVARVERVNQNNGAVIVKVNGLSASDATASTLVRRDSNGGANFAGTVNLAIGVISNLQFEDYQAAADATFLYGTNSASAHRIALGGVGDSSTGTALFGAATAAAARTTLELGATNSPTFGGLDLLTATTTTLNVYNSLSGANFERLSFSWASNIARIGTAKGGTGTARAMEFQTDGTTRLTLPAAGAVTVANRLNVTNTVSTYSNANPFVALTNAAGKTAAIFPGAVDGAIGFSVDSVTRFFIGGAPNSGLEIPSANSIAWVNPGVQTFSQILQDSTSPQALAIRNGTNAQISRIYDTYASATDYHRLAIATARATATAMSGATITLTNIIPAGAVVVGVTCKVTTAITGATSFQLGTAADSDRFGATIAIAAGTTSDNQNWTSGTIECFPAATSLILTANGSNFTAGAVYVSVQYLSGQAD